ncbi:MAG: ABC transporter substrate-binding protein [Bifidobacteriaceae bacterium]|jgi:D-methionine transport system substrate-binding protein|nr:ABC transporter substrate-binding protein [Bifidobacteriaceae bacterium]
MTDKRSVFQKGILSIFLSLVLVLGVSLSACSDNPIPRGELNNPIKIGVVKSSDPQWKILQDGLLEQGLTVQIVNFSDYTSENSALSRQELDMNQFQHLDYLASYNYETGDDLVPIGATAVFPIGLYPNKLASVHALNDIKEGDTIVIPNDDTNQSRAIHLLVSAGLVEVNDSSQSILTPNNILETSKVKVKSVQANQAAHSLSDKSVSAAVINNDYIKDANLAPKDAILEEKADDEFAQRFINVWVVKKLYVNDSLVNKVVNWANNSQAFLNAIKENSAGTAQIVAKDYNAEKLQSILAKLQDEKTKE